MPPDLLLTATTADARRRLDVWLEGRLPDLSRVRIQALIRAGQITLNGAPSKPHQKIHAGDVAHVTIPAPADVPLVAQPIALDVRFEDDDLIVLNKPAGLVVHPAPGHPDGTLVNALLHHCPALPGIGGERRPGIVHRLDRDTSGLMVVAKTELAMHALVEQFHDGRVHKEYLALVHGIPRPTEDTIESLIGRSPHDRKKMSARPAHGRPATTHYRTLGHTPAVTLLAVRIATGRTHQIRVHLAHRGHPVVGDTVYGRPRASPAAARQMLHAHRLAFTHPRSGDPLALEAPPPADMAGLLHALGLAACVA